MADWPDLDSLKRTLNVPSTDFDLELEAVLASAIALVQVDVGDESVEPDWRLSEAARLLAVRMAKAAAEGTDPIPRIEDYKYQRLLKGHRRSFGVA